jgi:hypothetical protein
MCIVSAFDEIITPDDLDSDENKKSMESSKGETRWIDIP